MISAIILAAGLSRRMGSPKTTLSWGSTTVIGQIVSVLHKAGLDDILVVSGGAHEKIVQALLDLPVRIIFNPEFANDDMAISLQVGLAALNPSTQAVMVVLGDQPQIKVEVVQRLIEAYQIKNSQLVIPSYKMRRGHPWLIDRSLWAEIQSLRQPKTLRTFLEQHAKEIEYLNVDDDSILRDLDTPEDYAREKPTDPAR